MKPVHPELLALRQKIDAVDAELLNLLARRFAIVDLVIEVKRTAGLPAVIPERIEQVVQNLVQKAEWTNVPPETVDRLWRTLIEETIRYEEKSLPRLK